MSGGVGMLGANVAGGAAAAGKKNKNKKKKKSNQGKPKGGGYTNAINLDVVKQLEDMASKAMENKANTPAVTAELDLLLAVVRQVAAAHERRVTIDNKTIIITLSSQQYAYLDGVVKTVKIDVPGTWYTRQKGGAWTAA